MNLPDGSFRHKLPPGWRSVIECLLWMLAAVVLLAPVLQGAFIWDDQDYLTANRLVQSPEGLLGIWFSPLESPQYYPMVFTNFWLEFHLWGLHPFGYHLTNLLLHGANAFLFWRLLGRWRIPGAFLAASLFLVHPMNIETLAWVAERKNLLALFFSLLALGLWQIALERQPEGTPANAGPKIDGPLWLGLLAFYFLALASKSIAVGLPLVLGLLLWWRKARLTRDRLIGLGLLLLLGGLWSLGTIWMERHQVGARGEAFDISLFQRLLIASRNLGFYFFQLVWPQNLMRIYPRWSVPMSLWPSLLYPLGLAAGGMLAWKNASRGGLVWFLGSLMLLAPALGLVSFYPMIFSFVADHYTYLAMPMLVLGPTWLLMRAPERLRPWAGALVVVTLTIQSLLQARLYHSPERLWLDTLQRNSQAWAGWINLGDAYRGARQDTRALGCYNRTLALHPQASLAWAQKAEILESFGRLDEALQAHCQVFVHSPHLLEKLHLPHQGNQVDPRAIVIQRIERSLRSGARKEAIAWSLFWLQQHPDDAEFQQVRAALAS